MLYLYGHVVVDYVKLSNVVNMQITHREVAPQTKDVYTLDGVQPRGYLEVITPLHVVVKVTINWNI